MNIKATMRSGISILMAMLLPGAQAAWAAELAADLGGRQVVVTGSGEKFNEYRDVREGLFVDDLRLGVEREAYHLDIEAENGGLKNERYSLSGGRYGKFKAAVSYDAIPHNFSRGRSILSGTGSDRQGISSSIQTALQGNEETRAVRGGVSTTDPTGKDAAQRNLIRDVIANSDAKAFGIDRKKAAMAFEFNATPNFKGWVKASEERRMGARVMGTGSYERYAQTTAAINGDGGHSSDMFVVLGQQVAEPVDYRTTAINFGGGYYSKAVSADLEYTFSEFKDDLASLTWANPFRNSDASAMSAADALGTDAAGASGYGRARFAFGRLALPPNNRSHDVAATASVELPLDGRLAASFGFGEVAQHSELLPYTSNSAINAAIGAPANTTGTGSLPVERFSGKVQTLTQSLQLTLKPLEKLATHAKYRVYTYDNKSPRILFPGYAAYGESHWRTRKNDSAALGSGATNEVVSYNRQTAELGADYEIFEPLKVGVEGLWDRWAYKNNRVNATDEVGASGSAALRLGHGLKAHGKYLYAHRSAENYQLGATASNPEAVGLVNYNWADRVRHRVEAGVSSQPFDDLSIGVDGHYQDDAFGAGDRFGLKSDKSKGVALDIAVTPTEAFELSLTLSKEERRGMIQNAAKDNAFNNTATSLDDSWSANSFNPLNYWNTETIDKVDTVSVEASYRPSENWEFGGGYSFSNGRTSFVTTNPNEAEARAAGYAQGAKLANGVAQIWPSITSRLHELRLGGAYKLTKDVSFGLDYAFAKYMLNDFANVGEYGTGATPENATRFVLAGADRFDYTAHVVGARVAMRF